MKSLRRALLEWLVFDAPAIPPFTWLAPHAIGWLLNSSAERRK